MAKAYADRIQKNLMWEDEFVPTATMLRSKYFRYSEWNRLCIKLMKYLMKSTIFHFMSQDLQMHLILILFTLI